MGKGERPTIDKGASKPRHDRYAAAIKRCNEAMQQGFYIEAIAIEESLIADRLESLTNEITKGGWSYKPAGKLAWNLQKKLQPFLNVELIDRVKEIQKWCRLRNNAIHCMAKLTPTLTSSFDEDYAELQAVAEEGKKVFRGIDDAIRKYRKAKS